jgi:site-specific recombinase XerC
MPVHLEGITREHVQEFILDQLEHNKPATAWLRYASLRLFFKWLVEVDAIPSSPMAKMQPPRIPESLPPVMEKAKVRALLDVCDRDKTFEGYRDLAILRVFADSGLRLSELQGLMLWRDLDKHGLPDTSTGDLDLKRKLLRVVGKGNRERHPAMSTKAVGALHNYLRVRGRHKSKDLKNLWLSRSGGLLKAHAIARMLKRRAEQAGIGDIHPHLLRHFFAHRYKMAGGSEEALMKQAGWKNPDMARRYAASAATERAHAEFERLNIGDDL